MSTSLRDGSGASADSTRAASVRFAAASIAARDLRTWFESVVYQKSGSDALM